MEPLSQPSALLDPPPPDALKRGPGYRLLLVAWALWVSTVIAAPLLASTGGHGIAQAIYSFFGTICHQQPARSFIISGHPFAVCHRCFGLYLGLGAGLLFLPVLPALRRRLEATPKLLVVFALPMLLDVLLFRHNVPTSRFVTGFSASFPIALFCWIAAEQIVSSLCSDHRGPSTPKST